MRLNDGGAGATEWLGGDGETPCIRPSLGALFPAAVAAWATAVVAEEICWRLSAQRELADIGCAAAVLAVALTAAVFIWGRVRGSGVRGVVRLVALPALAAVCVAICAGLCWGGLDADRQVLSQRLVAGGVEVEVTGDAVQRDYGIVSTAEYAAATHRIALRVTWPEGIEVPTPGHRVLVSGSLGNSADEGARRWNHRNRYVGMLRASDVEERGRAPGLRGAVAGFRDAAFSDLSRLGGDEAGLLAGVVLGNRTLYAGTELEQAFRTTGLAHLMAVSGTHLAVVSALLGWLLGRSPLRRRSRTVVLGCMLALYAALTGFSSSALRACAMCLTGLSGGVLGRRRDVLSALSACAVAFIACDPPVAFSTGFLLSVLAVFGLVAFSGLCASWLGCLLPAPLERLREPTAATCAATLPTLPVTVPLFVQFPLIAPFATLLAAPLVTLALGAGLVAVCVAHSLPALASPALAAAGVPARACATLVRWLADIPGACVPLDESAPLLGVLLALALVLLWAMWPDPARMRSSRTARLAAAAVFALPVLALLVSGLGGPRVAPNVLPGFSSSAQVVMLDVGQGDAMLVRDGDAALLVDTGEDGDVLKRDLARNGVVHLDAVYITHKDADHCGALSALAGVVGVDHVFVHADLLDYDGERKVLEAARWVTAGKGAEGVRPGARARAGAFTLTMLAPQDGGESENGDSLVNLLEYDADGDGAPEARGLLTGDAEAVDLADVCPRVGDVDFVKVGHHGSAGAFTAEQLSVLRPEFALIGVGLNNRYGHPTQETLGLLDQAGCAVYRTDLDGDVVVSFSKERIGVTVQGGRRDM